jgi:hypothetical protein
MASLFDLLGLNSASGMPSSMSDEEQAAMLQNGGTGMSALLGLSPDVLTNAYGTPSTQAKQDAVHSAEQNAAAQNQAQAASTAQDNSQETQPAPQAQSDTDNSPAPTTNTDTPIAQASGQPDVSVDSASDDSTNSGGSNSTNSDSSFTPSSGLLAPSSSGSDSSSTTDSSPGFLSKLLHAAATNQNLFPSLMAAGAGMLAHSNYGTSGWSAVGQGMQDGMQTYQARQQQQFQNAINMAAAQRQNALDSAKIAGANATTAQTNQAVQNRANFMKYMSSNPTNVTPQSVLSNGGGTDDIKSLFPTMQTVTGDDGTVYSFNPQGGGLTKIGQTVKTQATPAGTVINQVGSGPNGAAQVTPVSGTSLTPEQQGKVQTYSDNAANYKAKANQLGTYIQAMQDPAYQQAQASGVPGAVQAYLRSKGLTSDPVQVINQTIANEQTAGNLSTIESSGVSRLDQKTQENVIKNGIDVNTASPQTRLALAQDIFDSYRNQYNQNYRAAQWDGSGLGNSTSKQVQLNDGTVIPSGTNRTDYIGANAVTNNPMQKGNQSAPAQTAVQAQARIIAMARSGNKQAQALLTQRGIQY